MDLGNYEQTKFQLAELLRAVGAANSQRSRQIQDQLGDLFSRLAEDRFNLVVVGRFSRGKSSLMNAVLGADRLPTGIRPLTSVITTVTYGSAEKAVIHYAGVGLPDEVPLAALPEFITEQGNSANHRKVRIAEVLLPVELLRRGFHFIDTPGLGSPIVENTRTTERFLPAADAFVLVTSYEGPLSDEEVRFLRDASAAGHPVFIVVNKQDMATSAERKDALQYMGEQLQSMPDYQSRRIFSLSARDGLEAKQKGDARLLATSGIGAFEAKLMHFLINEKSDEFLLRMCQRIAAVVAQLPHGAEAARLSERTVAIARRTGRRGSLPLSPVVESSLGAGDAYSRMQSRPCEVCEYVSNRCSEFLRTFQYEITVNSDRQKQLAERGGLCTFHTWLYEQFASPHGTCVGFAGVLDGWASRLLAVATPGAGSGTVPTEPKPIRVPEVAGCLVCEARAAEESTTVASIAGRLRHNPENALTSLSQLCLPHVRLLAAAVGDGPVAAKLLALEAVSLRRIAEDMRRYALKHDGVRRYLASDEDKGAPQKALSIIAGHPTLNTQPPRR